MSVLSSSAATCLSRLRARVRGGRQTDLAIHNCIANSTFEPDAVNRDFVNANTVFRKTAADIGCGLRPAGARGPGNAPFTLTGPPPACGTAREVDTFADRLPADMVGNDEEHRPVRVTAGSFPAGTIPGKPGSPAGLMTLMLKDGSLNCHWVQCTNNMQAAANMDAACPGGCDPDKSITVADPDPTVTALAADLILSRPRRTGGPRARRRRQAPRCAGEGAAAPAPTVRRPQRCSLA